MRQRLKYLYQDRDRHGNVRIYFKRPGASKVRLREAPGSAELMAAYARLMADPAPAAARPSTARPATGTLRWLCVEYFASPACRRLDPQTQRTRRLILERCLEEPVHPGAAETFADFPLARLTVKALRVLRDRKADLPEAANGRVRALRRLYAWAADEELVDADIARDLKRVRVASEGWHTWSLEEVAQFRAHYASGTKARLALEILLATGVRRSDAVRLGRQHVRDGWIRFQQWKNRNRNPVTIEIPVLPALAAELQAGAAGGMTWLLTEYGRPFTIAGFGNWFRDRCDEAGLPQCSAHGLRKAGATIAAENGATPHQLMAIFGWSNLDQAVTYTRRAARRRLAGDAMALMVPKAAEDKP